MNESRRLFAIKVGNTNIGLGIFERAAKTETPRLLHTWRVETRAEKTSDEYGALLGRFLEGSAVIPASFDSVALVSVVPALTDTLCEMSVKYLGHEPFIAAPGVRSGLRIRYDDPRSLGPDRLVSLVAARARYGVPSIVIDLGTATTFNALDARGDFVGGAIAAGLTMSAEALHQFTARLPRVEVVAPERAVATNTADALRAGLFFGHAALVEGMVARFRRELREPDAHVIATGGLAAVLAPYCPVIDVVDPDLGLYGLYLLYEMNRSAKA